MRGHRQAQQAKAGNISYIITITLKLTWLLLIALLLAADATEAATCVKGAQVRTTAPAAVEIVSNERSRVYDQSNRLPFALRRQHAEQKRSIQLDASASTRQDEAPNNNNKDEENKDVQGPNVGDCGLHLLRLPERIVPSHYNLVVMPDMESLSFEGAVQINVAIKGGERTRRRDFLKLNPSQNSRRRSNWTNINANANMQAQEGLVVNHKQHREPDNNQIVLHADSLLTVDNVWYLDFGYENEFSHVGADRARKPTVKNVGIRDICQDPEYELLVITLAKDLKPGTRGQLHLTFAGALSDDMRGFYKSAYRSSQTNETRYHATTQFQATEARRAFPCFDEPALKATFDVTLIHSADRISLANMEPIYERLVLGDSDSQNKEDSYTEEEGNQDEANNNDLRTKLQTEFKLVRFARTPPMSTYLLAFIIGEFDFVERIVFSKLRVRVYTPVGRSKQGQFALDTACRAISIMQDYFGIDFPLNKLDLVAIPDFDAGAMENWGLITFKEGQLLVDELNISPDSKALVASTVVHELAHQWFGNLVTMEWWNELWLNEGFATWLEYKMSDELYPEFDFKFRYLLDSHIYALSEDSFRSAHPIEPRILEHTSEIDDLFDAISYNKAAAIIRILHDDYLKPQPFKEAIGQYLSSNKYANTETTDLWESMELSGQLPVRQFMQSWLSQAGHPMLKLSFDSNSNKLAIEQERFTTNVGLLKSREREQRWLVPISMLISSGGNSETLEVNQFTLDRAKDAYLKLPASFNVSSVGCWLKLNANFSGFYRVQYPDLLYNLMRKPTETKRMPPADRLNLLDETSALAIANKVPAMRLLDTITWFEHEDNGAVLCTLVDAFRSLMEIVEQDSDLYDKLTRFGHQLFGKIWSEKLGAVGGIREGGREGADGIEAAHMALRAKAATLSLLIDLNYDRAINESLNLLTNSNMRVASFLREPVYTAIAKRGSDAYLDWLYAKLESTESREERARLVEALSKVTQQDRLMRIWRWLKQKSLPIDQDQKLRALGNILGKKEGRQFVLNLAKVKGPDEVLSMEASRSIISLILEYHLLAGEISQREEASKAFPELLSKAQTVEAEWPEYTNELVRMLARKTESLRQSSRQIRFALDRYMAGTRSQTLSLSQAN